MGRKALPVPENDSFIQLPPASGNVPFEFGGRHRLDIRLGVCSTHRFFVVRGPSDIVGEAHPCASATAGFGSVSFHLVKPRIVFARLGARPGFLYESVSRAGADSASAAA